MSEISSGYSATYQVLVVGYTSATGPNKSNAGTQVTVSYIHDGDHHIIVDPRMVANRSLIFDPLTALGLTAADITEVVLSHHHPDNIMNVGLFLNAQVHDHKAIYHNDEWIDRDTNNYSLTDSIKLITTPSHSPQDITVLAGTMKEIVAFVGDL